MRIGILAVLLFVYVNTQAKTLQGVYLTAADFKNGKLAYTTDCHKDGLKVRLNDFFHDEPSFVIKYNGEKITMKKDEVYGYKDCENTVYRFYKNESYRIVEAGNIFIYAQQHNETQTKGFIVVREYFFSTSLEGPVIRLTALNFNTAYRDNQNFIDVLKAYNGYMSGYDAEHHMFSVNYLYLKSKK